MSKRKNGKRHPMTRGKALVPHVEKCGAQTRSGKPCSFVAGYKTPHVGQGRCHLHGGLSLTHHGRYSTITRESLRALIEQHEADPDPLNILPELASARALYQDFIQRYDGWREALLAWHESFATKVPTQQTEKEIAKEPDDDSTPKPRQILDIADAYRIVSEITKIAERIERIRSQNAISRPELMRVMSEMGRVVEAHVRETATQEKIRDAWLAIRV